MAVTVPIPPCRRHLASPQKAGASFFLLLKLDRSFAELLHSGCPVLEDLVLVGCHISWHSIQFTEELVPRQLSQGTLIIRAPCLASLRLYFPYHGYGNGVSLDMNRTFFFCRVSETLGKASIALGKLYMAIVLSTKKFLLSTIFRALGKTFAVCQNALGKIK